MVRLNEIVESTEMELVVSFFDLTRFAKYTSGLTPQEYFKLVSAYYDFVGDVVERDEGLVVKFMGDAGLIVYPVEKADAAVTNLKELKNVGDEWMKSRGAPCKHVIKAHVGSVICGSVGTKREQRFDVFGKTVMTAAVLQSNGFAITPQLFRKLNAETRKLLKKHTPPVTYISVEESHQDN